MMSDFLLSLVRLAAGSPAIVQPRPRERDPGTNIDELGGDEGALSGIVAGDEPGKSGSIVALAPKSASPIPEAGKAPAGRDEHHTRPEVVESPAEARSPMLAPPPGSVPPGVGTRLASESPPHSGLASATSTVPSISDAILIASPVVGERPAPESVEPQIGLPSVVGHADDPSEVLPRDLGVTRWSEAPSPAARQVAVRALVPAPTLVARVPSPAAAEPAQAVAVEVHIGSVEIVPATPVSVPNPPRRVPRGFDLATAARRYLNRRWY